MTQFRSLTWEHLLVADTWREVMKEALALATHYHTHSATPTTPAKPPHNTPAL